MLLWDAANIDRIVLHGVSTEEAEEVIKNDPLDIQRQFRNGELRFVHLGETFGGRVLYVIVTPRGKDLRVVTAFPADRQSRMYYGKQKERDFGKGDRDA